MADKYKNGFTLVEILIVVAILAFLAVTTIGFFLPQISKGRDAKRKGDLDRIKIAIEEYEKDYNCYPPSALLECNPGTGLAPYLDKIPCDQTTDLSYYYQSEAGTCPTWFRLYFKLQFEKDAKARPLCAASDGNSYDYYVTSANAPSCPGM